MLRRLLTGLLFAFLSASPAAAQSEGLDLFERKIRPVLVEHCYSCHSAEAQKNKKLKGGLLLDSCAGIRQGGDSGPALKEGDLTGGLLLKALRYDDELRMPPK